MSTTEQQSSRNASMDLQSFLNESFNKFQKGRFSCVLEKFIIDEKDDTKKADVRKKLQETWNLVHSNNKIDITCVASKESAKICSATTSSGKPCQNLCKGTTDKCASHSREQKAKGSKSKTSDIRCEGKTAKNDRCSKMALIDSKFCSIHGKDKKVCQGKKGKNKDEDCTAAAKKGSDYCARHVPKTKKGSDDDGSDDDVAKPSDDDEPKKKSKKEPKKKPESDDDE